MPYISTFYIANQCPLSGGNAVYRARSLLRKYVDVVYDDTNLCQQAGLQWRATEAEYGGFKIYPNPAKDGFTVEYPAVTEGVTVLESPIPPNLFSSFVLLSGIEAGIYGIQIKDEQNFILYQDKIVVIK